MAKDFLRINKRPMRVNSGFRTWAEQKKQWDDSGHNKKKASPPGGSRHETGVAIDIQSEDVNLADSQNLLNRWSLTRPMYPESKAKALGTVTEAWHVEPVETANRLKPLASSTRQMAAAGAAPRSQQTGDMLPADDLFASSNDSAYISASSSITSDSARRTFGYGHHSETKMPPMMMPNFSSQASTENPRGVLMLDIQEPYLMIARHWVFSSGGVV
jgi:hypothetical protein